MEIQLPFPSSGKYEIKNGPQGKYIEIAPSRPVVSASFNEYSQIQLPYRQGIISPIDGAVCEVISGKEMYIDNKAAHTENIVVIGNGELEVRIEHIEATVKEGDQVQRLDQIGYVFGKRAHPFGGIYPPHIHLRITHKSNDPVFVHFY